MFPASVLKLKEDSILDVYSALLDALEDNAGSRWPLAIELEDEESS
jgi:hypothetical protein